ncbi:MAG TPA: hypothetical protein VGF53_01355 [Pseudolabrys sp.]|jgi:hypothetical protein
MLRPIAVIGLLPLLLLASPASAVTKAEKAETCKVGADSQQLEGVKRNAFIKKCMAQGNFEPAGRKAAKKSASKKPMAKKPAEQTPADAQPTPKPY